MQKEIERLQKELAAKMSTQKQQMATKSAVQSLSGVDINKYIKNGQINVNGVVTEIKSKLNKINADVARMK